MAFIFNVGLSRVALGVHSFNQVVYGWSYGLWLALFLFRYVRPQMKTHISRILDYNHESKPNSLLIYVLFATVLYLAIVLFSILNFTWASMAFVAPQSWITALQTKCQAELIPNSIFVNSAFIKTGLVSSIFGAYFGIVIDSLYMCGTKTSFNDTGFCKGILRLIVGCLMAAPFVMPYLFMSPHFNTYTLYVFKTALPFFILMLLVFSVLKLVFIKLDLANLKDH